ncbi:MAG: response regulator [Lachnospiraceae bacterium]|nr:response regulator [Lachnospiraceae bacterium]
METLFIADDETSIRNGLKCIIDWEELGFSLCGEASNGKDALSKILALRPGLVLLDVKMPGMHGTEVIRRAREEGFQGKCIILSGYSDFKYAQEAIKSGVRFYLTKPIDEDELIQTVTQIREELAEEQQRSSHLTQYKNKAKNVVLHELLHSAPETPLSEEDHRLFRLTADVYQVVICEDFHAPSSTAPFPFAEMLKVTNRDNIIFDHLNTDGRDVVLLKGVHALNKFSAFLERLEQGDSQKGSPLDSMFLAYGRPVHAVEDLHLSYGDASALLTRRFFCMPGQHAAGYDTLPHTGGNPSPASPASAPFTWDADTVADYAGRLTDYIGAYNRRMTVDTLQEIELGLMSVPNEINDIRLLLIDLYLQIKENLTRNYPSAGFSFRNNSEAIEYIHGRSYLYEILRFLSEQSEAAMNALGSSSKDTILADVLFYIDHNFHKNIKLEAIAPLFGYNSAYLGKIFTKSVGESFNSYVDHRRIEHSKKLLLENRLKVYEIAEHACYKHV